VIFHQTQVHIQYLIYQVLLGVYQYVGLLQEFFLELKVVKDNEKLKEHEQIHHKGNGD